MTEMDISPKKLEEVVKFPEDLLTFNAKVMHGDEVVFIEWHAYSVRLDRDHAEIHLIGHDVTRFKEMERELALLKTELQTFSETMYPMWKSIKNNLSGENEIGNNESFDDLSQKAMAFNRLYEELLSKIGYKFVVNAYRS